MITSHFDPRYRIWRGVQQTKGQTNVELSDFRNTNSILTLEAEIESAGCKEVISDDVDVFGEESESSGDDLKRSDEIRQQQEE